MLITRHGARPLAALDRVALPAGTQIVEIARNALGGRPEGRDLWLPAAQRILIPRLAGQGALRAGARSASRLPAGRWRIRRLSEPGRRCDLLRAPLRPARGGLCRRAGTGLGRSAERVGLKFEVAKHARQHLRQILGDQAGAEGARRLHIATRRPSRPPASAQARAPAAPRSSPPATSPAPAVASQGAARSWTAELIEQAPEASAMTVFGALEQHHAAGRARRPRAWPRPWNRPVPGLRAHPAAPRCRGTIARIRRRAAVSTQRGCSMAKSASGASAKAVSASASSTTAGAPARSCNATGTRSRRPRQAQPRPEAQGVDPPILQHPRPARRHPSTRRSMIAVQLRRAFHHGRAGGGHRRKPAPTLSRPPRRQPRRAGATHRPPKPQARGRGGTLCSLRPTLHRRQGRPPCRSGARCPSPLGPKPPGRQPDVDPAILPQATGPEARRCPSFSAWKVTVRSARTARCPAPSSAP